MLLAVAENSEKLVNSSGTHEDIHAEQVPVLWNDDKGIARPNNSGSGEGCALENTDFLYRACKISKSGNHKSLKLQPIV